MKACGLIVEYNPFHHGHAYHLQEAKKQTGADCMIAVMSGDFLQRGEPAIIDKFHRTKAALCAGIDIVIELPYAYAVQNSDLFAKGAVQSLYEIGVSSICFGSESGDISYFIAGYKTFKEQQPLYQKTLHHYLDEGMSFPEASRYAYQEIGLTTEAMNLARPNNILGFSYVKAILEQSLPIQATTIKRTKSDYHDTTITNSIASATSIRKQLLENHQIIPEIRETMAQETIKQLEQYKETAGTWHAWERYFQLLHYRVLTMSLEELQAIQGVDEGLEHRVKKTAKEATSFNDWVQAIKTKRYTWTRLQRMFVHILTNTTKEDLEKLDQHASVPYIRLLGLTQTGRAYLNIQKKQTDIPIITKTSRTMDPLFFLEEKASNAYYSILSPERRNRLRKQELQPPLMM